MTRHVFLAGALAEIPLLRGGVHGWRPVQARASWWRLRSGEAALVADAETRVEGWRGEVRDPAWWSLADRFAGVEEGLTRRAPLSVYVDGSLDLATGWTVAPAQIRHARRILRGEVVPRRGS
jgi:hypothetical protein